MGKAKKSTKFEKSDPKIQQIRKSSLIWRFRFYGFFKNLKFFEPFLLIMLLEINLTLFQIGILMFITELITYLMEIPSGIFADKTGRKRVLMFCFLFYIGSFIFYFLGILQGGGSFSFAILALASTLFGLGEAFRSGSHKAMELMWMERNDLLDYKAYVYGNTRAYSLIGASLSAIIGIFLALNVPAKNWIFLATAIPYIIDFFLIMSYPAYMNDVENSVDVSLKSEISESFKNIIPTLKQNKQLRNGLISSSLYDAIFKSLKDYIQPIMEIYIIIMIQRYSLSGTNDYWLSIILGITYCVFYLFSSFASKNAFRAKNLCRSSKGVMDLLFDVFSFTLLLIGIFVLLQFPIIILILYLIIYILENLRRPNAIDYLAEIIPSGERATMLSVESQLKAIFKLMFAPIFGFIADRNIGVLFLIIAGGIFILNRFLRQTGKPCPVLSSEE